MLSKSELYFVAILFSNSPSTIWVLVPSNQLLGLKTFFNMAFCFVVFNIFVMFLNGMWWTGVFSVFFFGVFKSIFVFLSGVCCWCYLLYFLFFSLVVVYFLFSGSAYLNLFSSSILVSVVVLFTLFSSLAEVHS